MREHLLEKAREQVEWVDSTLRAAALLRIARAESVGDGSRARQTLLDGLDAVQKLSGSSREYLLDEASAVAAAVSPELLVAIPVAERELQGPFASMRSVRVVQTMLAYGHVDAAFEYMLHNDDPKSFPFLSVGGVLHQLDQRNSESAARRLSLLRHAVEMWRKSPSGPHRHESSHFVGFFGHVWKELPPEEALTLARTIVDRAAKEPDTGTSAGYPNDIHFTSLRQNTLFQILHVLLHLDPALAESLVGSHDQLALAARRYPKGLETMNEEMEAEAERRKADGAVCQGGTCGGYILTGDSGDFDRQRRIIDAARGGDFAPSIEDALEKYQQDTSPDAPNYAPKEFWPSTGAFRSVLYQAGRRMGSDAATLLERIPDDDLRLFAAIELAAALAGVPAAPITSMKRPHPPDSQGIPGRIIAASCTTGIHRSEPHGPPMRSPDGRLIRCPTCLFQPSDDLRWSCKCGHRWNTFRTAGKCPTCHFQWEVTGCPRCGEMSEHRTWYQSEP